MQVFEPAFDIDHAAGVYPAAYELLSTGGGTPVDPPYVLPEPTQTVWDFDHESVTSWDSDVVTTGTSQLNSAIDSAMQASSGTYHRITVTDTSFANSVVLFLSTTIPPDDVYILVRPQTTCVFNERLRLNGPSNCKWIDFEFRGTTAATSDKCFELLRSGVSHSLFNCKIGHFFAGLSNPANYPVGIGGGSGSRRNITVKNCEIRGINAGFDTFDGKYNFSHNFVTDFVDDVFSAQTANAGTNSVYVYMAGNVGMDAADLAGSPLHPDFLQTGGGADGINDSYVIETYENIFIGDSVVQDASQGLFCSLDTGSANTCTLTSKNNIMLVTGNNGINLSDRRSIVSGCMIAKPPTGARVPTTSPFPASLQPQELRLRGDAVNGQSGIPVIENMLFGGFNDVEPWGVAPINTITADHRQPLGGPESYDTVFPNMTGLIYDTDQVVIPAYAGARDIASVRSYVANEYQPLGGWSSIGMVSPVNWS